jgi:hypothetical protein
MAGPDLHNSNSGEIHAVITEQLQETLDRVNRVEEENRLLRRALERILGKPPPQGDDPDDEVAAARRRRRERRGLRHAGFTAVPLGAAAFLRSHSSAWALTAAAGAGAVAITAGGVMLAVDNDPSHPRTPSPQVFAPAAATPGSTSSQSPGRASLSPPAARHGNRGTASRHPGDAPTPTRTGHAVPPVISSPPGQPPSPPGPAHVPPGHGHAPGYLKHQLPALPPSPPAPIASVTSQLPTPGASLP